MAWSIRFYVSKDDCLHNNVIYRMWSNSLTTVGWYSSVLFSNKYLALVLQHRVEVCGFVLWVTQIDWVQWSLAELSNVDIGSKTMRTERGSLYLQRDLTNACLTLHITKLSLCKKPQYSMSFRLDWILGKISSQKRYWNRLPGTVQESLSWEVFKSHVDVTLRDTVFVVE